MVQATVAGRLTWLAASVAGAVEETPRVRTLDLDVPGWPGHRAGQHVDVRLTAEDSYQAQRSYSIASAPEDNGVALTIERLEDGEVSTFLADELRIGDRIELRGPLGGYFTWTVEGGGPLALIAGGSGIVPLMAMVRHRMAKASHLPTHLLCSWRAAEEIIYHDELARFAARGNGLAVTHTLTRGAPPDWRGYTRRGDWEKLLPGPPWPEFRPPAFVCGAA